jgi:cytochrome c5
MAGEEKMNSHLVRVLWTVLLAVKIFTVPGMAVESSGQSGNSAPERTAKTHEKQQPSGERIFMNNCSRCHMPPMSIPPRITGTVIMHMRTRARLSEEDQRALLKYLAP